MSERMHFYPKGTTITFSTGEYSDYGIVGHVVVKDDLDLPSKVSEYRAETNPENSKNGDDLFGFVSWLIRNGAVEVSDTELVHLGSYGNFAEELIQAPSTPSKSS